MKTKQIIKMVIDTAMTTLLLLLMAFVLTGQELHEWLGVAMIILFIAHHALNIIWFKKVFKGKYTLSRIFVMGVTILLCLDMIGLAVSGVMMSGFVFDFLPIHGGAVFARRLHMLASHWGLILMSVHLGQHWKQIMGMGKKLFPSTKKSTYRTWMLRLCAVGISLCGIYAFIEQNIGSYLILKQAFVFFDFEKPTAQYFAEYISIIWMFTALSYYLNKALKKIKQKQK